MSIDKEFHVFDNGDIRIKQDVSAGRYRVIELHRWLQDFADENMERDSPSERIDDFLIILYSPYNIDQEVADHLYDGTIVVKEGTKTIEIWDYDYKDYAIKTL